MAHWVLVAAPVVLAAFAAAFAFVGCTNDYDVFTSSNVPPEKKKEFHERIAEDARAVSYWRLGEANLSEPALDSKDSRPGTYHPGVTLGAPGLLLEDPDTAAEFDGSPEAYVSVDHDAALNPATFTVMALVDLADGTDYRAVVSSRDIAAGNEERGYILYANPSNVFEAWIGNGDWQPLASTKGEKLGEHCVAMTYDGSTLKLYVDPISETEDPADELPVAGFLPNNAQELRIGAGTNEGPPSLVFHGVIDEVVIFNDVLTYSEIEELFVLAKCHMAMTS